LICLGVALRALIVHGGSFLLPNLFPAVSWELWKKIEFGMVYAIGAFFPLYVYNLFEGHAPRKPILFFVGVAGLLCIGVILTPQYIYGQLLEVSHLMLLLAFIYAVYSITKAWRAGNEDARTILFGVLASFPFILIEILKNSRFSPLRIEFMYLVELGVLVFLLFQVYLLANHYAKSYRKLETVNVDLEKKVQERTVELTTANVVRDRLLSVISHDIKSPLNSLRGILDMYNRGLITQDEFSHFAKQIEGDLGKTNLLVDNMLHWTASQLKGIQVKAERFDLTRLIEENIHLFERVTFNKNIDVRHNAPEKLIVNADRNILNMVIRNLLSNAIKFSHEGGLIQIMVKVTADSLLLQVIDEGLGMADETISNVLDAKNTVSQTGTIDEKGTGLGLSLCRDYLKQAGGLLTIDGTPRKGSTFSVVFPL
jgi:signal transduction histidine kinase